MARLGIVLYHGIDGGPELKEYGRIAEEAGFDSLWGTGRDFHEETFSLLGFLAGAARGIKLGRGVGKPPTRNPALRRTAGGGAGHTSAAPGPPAASWWGWAEARGR